MHTGTAVLAILDHLIKYPEGQVATHMFDSYLYAKDIGLASTPSLRKGEKRYTLPAIVDQLVACLRASPEPVTPLLVLLCFLPLLGLRGTFQDAILASSPNVG